MKTICLVTSSLKMGGAERVMSELANYLSSKEELDVHLIVLGGRGARFYAISDKVRVHEDTSGEIHSTRIGFIIKIMWTLRNKLKSIKPNAVLSFGGKYNSFVIIASLGLHIKTFISERSQPGISYGLVLDLLNPWIYRLAEGIIAQTSIAKKYIYIKTKHSNIVVIGNPIRKVQTGNIAREKTILNVGRFIKSKNQQRLVEIFNIIDPEHWKLIFLGDGPEYNRVKEFAKKSPVSDKVIFEGNTKNVDDYLARSSIFAFTSNSEGFPNALGEAMSAGLACVSYDCEAGPSDLIEDGVSAFLVPLANETRFKEKLQQLIRDQDLRKNLGEGAKKRMKCFDVQVVGEEYYSVLIN